MPNRITYWRTHTRPSTPKRYLFVEIMKSAHPHRRIDKIHLERKCLKENSKTQVEQKVPEEKLIVQSLCHAKQKCRPSLSLGGKHRAPHVSSAEISACKSSSVKLCASWPLNLLESTFLTRSSRFDVQMTLKIPSKFLHARHHRSNKLLEHENISPSSLYLFFCCNFYLSLEMLLDPLLFWLMMKTQ